jgi:hypothetical protein
VSVSIKIADSGLGIILTATDYLTVQELSAANLDFFTQHAQEFSSCRYWFVDFSQVTDTDADHAKIRRLASMHVEVSQMNLQLIVAVCSPADFSFGMTRMWEVLAEATGWQTSVFRSGEQAKIWIRSYINESLTFE